MNKIRILPALAAIILSIHSVSHAQSNDIDERILQLLEMRSCPGCDLEGADMSGAHLVGVILSGAKLDGADLSGARLSDADLSGASLVGANLQGAILNRSNLSAVDASNANMSATKLIESNLEDANLSNADLRWALFRNTNISRANMVGANLTNAEVASWRDDGTIFCQTIEPNGTLINRDCTAEKIEGFDTIRAETLAAQSVEQARLASAEAERELLAAEQAEAERLTAGTSAFDGLFKPRGAEFAYWDCKTIGQDGGAIAIEGYVLRGVESYCTLDNPVNVSGMNAVLFDADCAGEGYEWTQRIMLMAADFGIYYIADEYVAEWQSCAAE